MHRIERIAELADKRKNSPIVIVEGLDRCGKTTLVESLLSLIGNCERHHFGIPPLENTLAFYQNQIIDRITTCKSYGTGTIFDRSFISNYAYNGIFGGGVLGREHINTLTKVCVEEAFYFILLYSEPSSILRRLGEESKETKAGELSLSQINTIQSRFFQIFSELPTHRKTICTIEDLFIVDNNSRLEQRRARTNLEVLVNNIYGSKT